MTDPNPADFNFSGQFQYSQNWIFKRKWILLEYVSNNLDGICAAVVVHHKRDRNQTIMNDRMDRIERLLTMIAEKELHAFLDSREVTSKLYNPMQSEAELREVEKSRTIGVW